MSYTGNFDKDVQILSSNLQDFINTEFEKFKHLDYLVDDFCNLLLVPIHSLLLGQINNFIECIDEDEGLPKNIKKDLRKHIKELSAFHHNLVVQRLR